MALASRHATCSHNIQIGLVLHRQCFGKIPELGRAHSVWQAIRITRGDRDAIVIAHISARTGRMLNVNVKLVFERRRIDWFGKFVVRNGIARDFLVVGRTENRKWANGRRRSGHFWLRIGESDVCARLKLI